MQCHPTALRGGWFAHFVGVGVEALRDSGRFLGGTRSWLVTGQRFKPNTPLLVHFLARSPDGKEGRGTGESGLRNPR